MATTRVTRPADHSERIVWVDPDGGLIVDPTMPESTAVEIDRVPGESDAALSARLARAVETSRHVYVCGADADRIDFEREFVSLTKRPERLVDVAPSRN